jgi:DNA-binding LacI/PurR family transcriptional regulator
MALMGAVASELAPTGMALTLLSATSTGDLVPARDVPMDGALVYSCDPATPAIRWLHKRGLPLVYVDQDPDPAVPSVNVDDRGGARAVAQHLVDLGHRRIGAIVSVVGPPTAPVADPADLPMEHSTSERVKGWTEALAAAGVTADYVQAGEYGHDEFVRAARLLLDRPAPPTAVLCFSDTIAAAVLQEAQDRGLRVPQDLSVVGFDDNPLARRTRPMLTTVRQDSREKGRAAAAALSAVIAQDPDAPAGAVEHLLLPTDLVVRGSSGPAPS